MRHVSAALRAVEVSIAFDGPVGNQAGWTGDRVRLDRTGHSRHGWASGAWTNESDSTLLGETFARHRSRAVRPQLPLEQFYFRREHAESPVYDCAGAARDVSRIQQVDSLSGAGSEQENLEAIFRDLPSLDFSSSVVSPTSGGILSFACLQASSGAISASPDDCSQPSRAVDLSGPHFRGNHHVSMLRIFYDQTHFGTERSEQSFAGSAITCSRGRTHETFRFHLRFQVSQGRCEMRCSIFTRFFFAREDFAISV